MRPRLAASVQKLVVWISKIQRTQLGVRQVEVVEREGSKVEIVRGRCEKARKQVGEV